MIEETKSRTPVEKRLFHKLAPLKEPLAYQQSPATKRIIPSFNNPRITQPYLTMSQAFSLRHVPALTIASTTTFGGLWPMFDAKGAMLELGFPLHIANTPATYPVMIQGQTRTTILGLLLFIFYYRGKFAEVDTILAVLGAYGGVVDSFLVWNGGNKRWAAFRLVFSWLVSAWGLAGLTA
ncbi:hypothetical protein B0T22DRAFT_462099 [Podospora appendiculata]|uniref:Uncharacterized protein n=1 Tax=Podospora appendiculata TaxID=314037 RepID=A0AAE0XC37_9PEZI|nr:hypothetical protein B0T22DRAFT_462099 [Podospora appendiculata]